MFFTGYTFVMVNTNVKNIITTCRPMIGHLFHTITVMVKVKSIYEPSGPSGWSLSRFLYHEATWSMRNKIMI